MTEQAVILHLNNTLDILCPNLHMLNFEKIIHLRWKFIKIAIVVWIIRFYVGLIKQPCCSSKLYHNLKMYEVKKIIKIIKKDFEISILCKMFGFKTVQTYLKNKRTTCIFVVAFLVTLSKLFNKQKWNKIRYKWLWMEEAINEKFTLKIICRIWTL